MDFGASLSIFKEEPLQPFLIEILEFLWEVVQVKFWDFSLKDKFFVRFSLASIGREFKSETFSFRPFLKLDNLDFFSGSAQFW